MSKPQIKKAVLAYSGGLDTSIILKWLIEEYDCEVIAFSADLGQAEELDGIPQKAKDTGASACHIVDLREEFGLVSTEWLRGEYRYDEIGYRH